MYNKIIIILLSAMAFVNIYAVEDNEVLAIVDMDLSSIGNEVEQDDLKGYIFEYVYLNENKYDILELQDVEEKLVDIDITDFVAVSDRLNADLLLSGEIRKFTKSYFLKFNLYSSAKNEIVATEEFTFSKRNLRVVEKKEKDDKDVDIVKTIYDSIDKVCNSVINNYERQVLKEKIFSGYKTKRSGSSIELSYGLINMSLEPYYDDEDVYDEFYHVAKVGY
ncbi:MAG: hypothetical protein GY756_03545, partial [bacterium]|nr:hypothetical protein [bacterium]